jgi:c(7)-type cytochrome triheme protein
MALGAFCLLALAAGNAGPARAAEPAHGERIYRAVCIGCHQIGVLGAPKAGDRAAWEARLAKGLGPLVDNALNGFGKMPPRGGNPNLGAADVREAIRFMAGAELVTEATSGGGSAAVSAAVPVAAAGGAPGRSGPGTGPAPSDPQAPAGSGRGAEVVKRVCQGCHQIGVLGAPRIGSQKDWAPRLKKGADTLVHNAAKGIGNMPPKGGQPELTADDLRAAIAFMVRPPPAPASTAAAVAAAATGAASAASAPAATATPAQPPQGAGVNRFNRLLRPPASRNPPPLRDGIHDPANDGTAVLQPPRQAFEPLPDSASGNHVDWVLALEQGLIQPRWDLADPGRKPLVMDLNIVREVKGSMPNVVYPHKQHLQWLDCSNCHPKIFQPKKGANQISMAEILLGRKCGVCHGKVAFPVSECRRCHSQKKPELAHK